MQYLTQEEETALAISYKETSNVEARNKLIENQFPAIYKLALSMTKDDYIKDELVNTAVLALTEAAYKFNPCMGVRFYTWSKFIVRGAMLNYFSGNGNVDIRFRRERDHSFDFTTIAAHNEWDQLEREQTLYNIIQHINILPSDEKRVLNAYLQDDNLGLTAKLAAEWGLYKGTVKERRRKIINKLKRAIT